MQPSPPALALKQRHRAVLTAALSTHAAASPPWHVLVADDAAHDMLTALFTPPELRAFGITLLQRLSAASRPSVPSAPAHFVLSPTPDNVARLAADLSAAAPRFARAHASFTTAIPPPLLAALAAQLPLPSPLSRVRDLHAAFLPLQPRLFTLLRHPVAYAAVAAAAAAAPADGGDAVRAVVAALVDGLFSVCLTLGVVPVIRAQRAGPAEAVAAALDARLRDALPLFARAAPSARAFKRPLLLLLDRDLDHAPLLHHAWTYHALVHDCLPLRANHLTLPAPHRHPAPAAAAKPRDPKPRTYALDAEKDDFWRRHAASPFPHVAEAVEAALTRYRDDVDRLNARACQQQNSAAADPADSSAATTHPRGRDDAGSRLANAISSLPDLAKQKETIDKHTNIATALLTHINTRALDAFFELESQLVAEPPSASAQAAATYKPAVLELLRTGAADRDDADDNNNNNTSSTTAATDGADPHPAAKKETRRAGTPVDRIRLFLIYYERFGQALSEEDMVEFREALAAADPDFLAIVDYIGRKRGFRHDAGATTSATVAAAAPLAAAAAAAASLNADKLRGLMRSVVSSGVRGIAGVAQSAKQLVGRQRSSFAAAHTLELFMSEGARSAPDAADVLDGYLLFDPKLAPTGGKFLVDGDADGGRRPGAHRAVFSDAIVFVVGGGNYVEFEDCMRIADAAATERNVLYGTTDMLTPTSFIKQLSTVATLPQ